MRFVVVLDACVFYPAMLRDFLLRLAQTGLFAAKWTDRIHDEWIGALSHDRPELVPKLPRTRELIDQAIPDCLVVNYEAFVAGLQLPDPDDRHVLAAAIRCDAQIILTSNLKDFPNSTLAQYDIEAMHPDVFIEHQFGLSQALVLAVAKQHRSALSRPAMTPTEYLDALTGAGLVVSAEILRDYLDLI